MWLAEMGAAGWGGGGEVTGFTTLLLNCCVGVQRHMTVKLSELMIKLTLTSCLKGVLKPGIIRQPRQVHSIQTRGEDTNSELGWPFVQPSFQFAQPDH